jgi:hypothetical protein
LSSERKRRSCSSSSRKRAPAFPLRSAVSKTIDRLSCRFRWRAHLRAPGLTQRQTWRAWRVAGAALPTPSRFLEARHFRSDIRPIIRSITSSLVSCFSGIGVLSVLSVQRRGIPRIFIILGNRLHGTAAGARTLAPEDTRRGSENSAP